MDIKRFGAAGTFFYLEGIQLGAIGDKIVVLVDAGSLPVDGANAISPYIQKKRKWTFDIGAKTFPDLCIDDDTGETVGSQRTVAPSQPVPESMGDLALQPGKVGRSEEHTSELQSQSNIVCR